MTRRERMERRQERREEWGEKARARAKARFEGVSSIADRIPLGQPILVGHHSEGRSRRDAKRISNGMDKGVQESRLAERHDSKSKGIASALDRSIFSDDHDAADRLRERIKKNEDEAARYKAINKAWRKSKGDIDSMIEGGVVSMALALTIKTTMEQCPWLRSPFSTTNINARIRADKKRLAALED